MSEHSDLRASTEFAALLDTSARLGRDPLQVQAAGGNTSLKTGGAMWVKASGTWLAEARDREIMVPVEAGALRKAVIADDPAADRAAEFIASAENASGLRPSIETTVHAVIGWPVVLHSHCVASIAIALRADAEAVMCEKIADLDPVFVPYVKPGRDLSRAIHARINPGTRVILLGNHGLVVCGSTVREAETLLYRVSERLDPVTPPAEAGHRFGSDLAGTGWMPVAHGPTQGLAFYPERLSLAARGSCYPDHIVFLGPGIAVAEDGETPAQCFDRAAAVAQRLVIFPGRGAAIPQDASPSVQALAAAFGDVFGRVPTDAPIRTLSRAEEAAILNWDAEKHRQALDRARNS